MPSLKTNAVVDILAAITFILSTISGLVLKFVLPRGSGRIASNFLGIIRENWLTIHDWSSIIFIILIIIHLVLHWQWIKCIPKFFHKKEQCQLN